MDQYIGKLLDNRYELLELIGVGGMARVYKARCHRLNRLVAVKILREDMAQEVSNQPHMPNKVSPVSDTELTKIFRAGEKDGAFGVSVLVSAKKRVKKPITKADISDDTYSIMPHLYDENINTPTAEITKAGEGLAHHMKSRLASSSDMSSCLYASATALAPTG